jgi:adenine-specific DNA-methyltransferase
MQGTYWDFASETKNLTKEGNVSFPNGKKPLALLKRLLNMQSEKDYIVLDFFAGSGSTAHAVLQQNIEDNGNRRFIMVQLPEKAESDPESDDSFKNIAELSKERIRRSAKKIKEENPLFSGDLGFKVFKLDTSNIKTWEAGFDTLKDDLIAAADYIKQDRSSDDIVFELLLKYGLDLTVPIETRTIAGKKVYSIGLGALVVCLDNDVPMETVNGIGALKEELKPEIMRVVFKDSGFKDDVVKTNALQTLKRFGVEDIKSL